MLNKTMIRNFILMAATICFAGLAHAAQARAGAACATKPENAKAFLSNLPAKYQRFPIVLADIQDNLALNIRSVKGQLQLAGYHPMKGYEETFIKSICREGNKVRITFANNKTQDLTLKGDTLTFSVFTMNFELQPASEKTFAQIMNANGAKTQVAGGSSRSGVGNQQ